MTEPLLFPILREVLRLDPRRRHDHVVAEEHDPRLPAQGFAVSVDAERGVLRYSDEAGLRYGRQLVAQLSDGTGRVPTVELSDHPDMAVRGFMLDVSRDRVPTRETLDRLVTVLETCRYNHLQLYVEHTFAYRDHREVWAAASPLDAQDMRWLDERCRAAGIELAANQNCFGHFGRWLAHDRYRSRAECPDGFDLLPGVHLPPGVLAPTADNASFAVSLVREQVAAFDARIVNIGCDETFELGRGASRDRVERDGEASIYAEHVARIVGPLVDDGLDIQFWGDVIARHPEHLDLVRSDGATALVWNYDAPDAHRFTLPESLRAPLAEVGIDLTADTSFGSRLAPFAESGVRHWVAPGTSTWSSLVGRLDNARGNLLDAARGGITSGAEGLLVTDWGDGGHHQPLTVSYPAIAYGGAVAWGAEANADLRVAPVVDRLLLKDRAGILGEVLDAVGGVAGCTGMFAANASPLHAALLPGGLTTLDGSPDPEQVARVIAVLDDAGEALQRSRPDVAQPDQLVEELTVAVGLTRLGALDLGARAGLAVASPAERSVELDRLIDRYRAAWLTTSRPGGLDDSTAHLVRAAEALARIG